MLVDKMSSSVVLEFLLQEAQHAGGRSNDKRCWWFLYVDVCYRGWHLVENRSFLQASWTSSGVFR